MKPVTNADSFRGEFPERDVTGNSLMAHIGIVWAVVNRLLAAAAKIRLPRNRATTRPRCSV